MILVDKLLEAINIKFPEIYNDAVFLSDFFTEKQQEILENIFHEREDEVAVLELFNDEELEDIKKAGLQTQFIQTGRVRKRIWFTSYFGRRVLITRASEIALAVGRRYVNVLAVLHLLREIYKAFKTEDLEFLNNALLFLKIQYKIRELKAYRSTIIYGKATKDKRGRPTEVEYRVWIFTLEPYITDNMLFEKMERLLIDLPTSVPLEEKSRELNVEIDFDEVEGDYDTWYCYCWFLRRGALYEYTGTYNEAYKRWEIKRLLR